MGMSKSRHMNTQENLASKDLSVWLFENRTHTEVDKKKPANFTRK